MTVISLSSAVQVTMIMYVKFELYQELNQGLLVSESKFSLNHCAYVILSIVPPHLKVFICIFLATLIFVCIDRVYIKVIDRTI